MILIIIGSVVIILFAILYRREVVLRYNAETKNNKHLPQLKKLEKEIIPAYKANIKKLENEKSELEELLQQEIKKREAVEQRYHRIKEVLEQEQETTQEKSNIQENNAIEQLKQKFDEQIRANTADKKNGINQIVLQLYEEIEKRVQVEHLFNEETKKREHAEREAAQERANYVIAQREIQNERSKCALAQISLTQEKEAKEKLERQLSETKRTSVASH